jgi:hypothetical protein
MPRTVTTTLDSKDRSVQIAVPGLDPVAMAYDDTQGGRLSAITQGAASSRVLLDLRAAANVMATRRSAARQRQAEWRLDRVA